MNDLLKHKFVNGESSDVFDKQSNSLHKKFIQFAKLKPNQQILDTILRWLETWILADEKNAKLFDEGDIEYLDQCVHNLAHFCNNTTEYVDRYVADMYTELVNSGK